MRKITQDTARAMLLFKKKTIGNTSVIVQPTGHATMLLHGNPIASYKPRDGELYIEDCGWRTVTTKERLNGVLEVFGIDAYISQSKGNWYIITRSGQRYPWGGRLKVEL